MQGCLRRVCLFIFIVLKYVKKIKYKNKKDGYGDMKSIGATTSTLVYGGTDGYARLMFWIRTRIMLELGSLTPNVMLQV